jgi:carbonic anhydrase
MKKLINGILEFRKNLLATYRKEYAHLALGQAPDTLFIACSDSRVVPNLFASTNPGDLFVVRNVGNLVPPYATADSSESAAIEFSLYTLPISEIVVCGHSECGAMHAVLAGAERVEQPSLRGWLRHCCPPSAVAHSTLPPQNALAQANVLQQMRHLMTYPAVREGVEKGRIRLHGWYFDLATGDVYAYEPGLDAFALIDESEAARILSRLSG